MIERINEMKTNCTKCVHFTSWYDLYDQDKHEPKNSGICKDDWDKPVDEDDICKDFEELKKLAEESHVSRR